MNKPVQIVDKKGKFSGLADSPEKALLAGHIRLVSRVIILNDNGEYLLQKRADDMFIYPGFWDSSAAGHVDEGETPEDAAYRELQEEIGIHNIELKEVAQLYNEMKENHGFVSRIYSHVFTGFFNGNIAKLKLEPSEVTKIQWFSKEEIFEMINSGGNVTEGVKLIFNEAL